MPLTGYFEPSALTATAINAACVAAKAAGGGTVWLGNGNYTGDVTITFDPSCVSIEGADAVVDYSARTGNFIALTADATASGNYKRGLAHSLRGWILKGNSATGSVGLYLNTPLGAHDNSTTFNVENFVIERFGVNLDIGHNCYICTFRGLSLGWCVDSQIRRLSFANNGENMSFFGGQIFNGGGVALNLRASNQEWRFFGTSFDYNRQIMYTDAPVVEFHGCHFEASSANLASLQSWQGVFEGDNYARIKFFGGEIGLTNTQLTNIDHFFKAWGTGGLFVEFHGCEKPSSLHYKLGLCNDMSRIIEPKDRAEPAKSLTIDSKKIVYSDFRDGNNFKLLATSDFYLPNPTNAVDGQEGSYWIKQDPTGNRKLLAIGDKFLGEPITLSTTANYEDRIDYKVTDDNIEYKFNKRTNTMIAGSLNPIMLGQIESGGGTDPNTLMLLHFDGADGSTTFTDSSQYNRTLTRNGTPTISTAQSKFGGSSGLFDASGEYLSTGVQSDFNFGTSDFTIELFAYVLSYKDIAFIGTNHASWATAGIFACGLGNPNAQTNRFFAHIWDGGTYRVMISTSTPALNTWHHIAVVRVSGVWSFYLNGVLQASFTSATSFNLNGNNNTLIGRTGWDAASPNCYMDEMRISNVARYTSAFTPPTAPFNP